MPKGRHSFSIEMDAKSSKLTLVDLITKILLILTILNIAGNILNVVTWLMYPSLRDISLNSGLIASLVGKDGALVISSAIILFYATAYAIAAFGLFSKSKWAPLLIIAVSIVDRVLALVIFELQLNAAFLVWGAWKIVMISLAFYLLRKCNSAPGVARATFMLNSPNPRLRAVAQADNSQGQPDATRLERARTFANDTMNRFKPEILIPTFISTLRIGALPLFFYLYNLGNVTSCLILLAVCATTDFTDGYIARKLKATSTFGAYYDAVADFTLMAGIFAIFTLNGYYPVWLVLLMAISFTQFLVTSHYAGILYDPVGKYLGSVLYIGITLTLLLPTQAIFSFVQYAFLGLVVISLASRIVSLKEIFLNFRGKSGKD